MSDPAFAPDLEQLAQAIVALDNVPASSPEDILRLLPERLPKTGRGEAALLPDIANIILGGAARLDAPSSFAHMDPPTPWLSWVVTMWNARLNQNLLHPATAPIARQIEERLMAWLAPYYGMDGGHFCPGSTIANLTALWAARDLAGVTEVVAPSSAHISIAKAAHLLGLSYRAAPTDRTGRLLANGLHVGPEQALVLVAGATGSGVIDPLDLAGKAGWTHVDAAWAGPLRLSTQHRSLLDGIERADSIAISAHKLFFQPKEAALVLFRDTARAHHALSFGASYLATPNVGLLGSHGAGASALLATLWAWGEKGIAARIDRCMDLAKRFATMIAAQGELELLMEPQTGVVVWRHRTKDIAGMLADLPEPMRSVCTIDGESWLRCVAANPLLDLDMVEAAVLAAL